MLVEDLELEHLAKVTMVVQEQLMVLVAVAVQVLLEAMVLPLTEVMVV
jgi:type II secretory pathway component PulF